MFFIEKQLSAHCIHTNKINGLPIELGLLSSSGDGSGDGSGSGDSSGIIKDDILLFVDDLGSDGNSGLNESSPLKTLTKAFDIIAQTGWNNTAIIKIVNKVSLQNEISPVVLNSGVKGQQKNSVCITGNVELYKTVEANSITVIISPGYNTYMQHHLISSNNFITDDIGSYIIFDSGLPNNINSYNFISEVKYSSKLDSICAYVNCDSRETLNIFTSQQINVFKNTSILEFDNNTLHFKSPITIRNLNIQCNDFLYTDQTNKHNNYLYFTGQQKINLSGINFNIKKLNRSLLNLNTVLYNNIEIINVDCVITTGCSKIPLDDNIFYSNDSNLGIMVVSEIIEEYDGINFYFNNMPDATTNLYNSSCHMRRTKVPPSDSEDTAILSVDFLPTFINCNLSLFAAYGPHKLKFENINMSISENINMSISENLYCDASSSSISDDNLNFNGEIEINSSKCYFGFFWANNGVLTKISGSQVTFLYGGITFINKCELYISNLSTLFVHYDLRFYNNTQSKYAIEISD